MTDIQQNSGGDNSGSAMTAIVAILVIVIIALAAWFGFRGRGMTQPSGINVELNAPGGSGAPSNPAQ